MHNYNVEIINSFNQDKPKDQQGHFKSALQYCLHDRVIVAQPSSNTRGLEATTALNALPVSWAPAENFPEGGKTTDT